MQLFDTTINWLLETKVFDFDLMGWLLLAGFVWAIRRFVMLSDRALESLDEG